jgi:hypothetical protein
MLNTGVVIKGQGDFTFSFTDWEYFEKHKEEGLKSYEEEEVM